MHMALKTTLQQNTSVQIKQAYMQSTYKKQEVIAWQNLHVVNVLSIKPTKMTNYEIIYITSIQLRNQSKKKQQNM